MRQFTTIASGALRDITADPFFLVLQIATVLGVIVCAALPSISAAEHSRFVRDQSFSLLLTTGALAAVFAQMRAFTEEFRQGAADILMSRPVSPAMLVAGKLAGLASALAVICLTGAAAFAWMSEAAHDPEMIDYTSLGGLVAALVIALIAAAARQALLHKPFPLFASCAICACLGLGVLLRIAWTGAANFDLPGLMALPPLFLCLLAFAACLTPIAICAQPLGLALSGLVLFLLGLTADFLLSDLGESTGGTLLRGLLPSFQGYWILDAARIRLEPAHVLACTLHALCALLFWGSLGTVLLQRREIKGQGA